MPKSKRDYLKRDIAQAVNSIARAVLDVNNVYQQFANVAVNQIEQSPSPELNDSQTAVNPHANHAALLAETMTELAKQREVLLKFVADAWDLDEDTLMVYL